MEGVLGFRRAARPGRKWFRHLPVPEEMDGWFMVGVVWERPL